MSALKVSLADAPTDVLVHLVDNGPASIAELAAALAPPETITPARTVSYAIDLLRRIGYVRGYDTAYRWAATDQGIKAIDAARADVADSKDGER